METTIIPAYVQELIRELSETKSMLRTAQISSELWHRKYSHLLDDYVETLTRANRNAEHICECNCDSPKINKETGRRWADIYQEAKNGN